MEKFISLVTSFLVIPFLFLFCLIIWFIRASNKLNRYKIIIKESEKNLDIALAKRYDTICQMIKVAKSFAKYEKSTFTDLVKLRQESGIRGFENVIKNQDQAIEKIHVLAEAYPELKSSQEFLRLEDEIDDENEQLAAAKRIVNNNISIFNQEIVSFPTSQVANLKGMVEMDFLREENLDRKKSIDDFDYNV